jgi:hypothetical protein
LHALRPAHQANQRPLGKHSVTAHASTLGDMLGTFCSFARHLYSIRRGGEPRPYTFHASHSSSPSYYHSSQPSSPRLCFLRAMVWS